MKLPSRKSETGLLRQVWKEFNGLRDYVASLRPSPGRGTHIKHTSQGVTIGVLNDPAKKAEFIDIATMRVEEIHDNYLLCLKWDGQNFTSGTIQVGRPWLQRRYVYEDDADLTITYVSEQEVTATDGTTTETWKITRAYREGDMIVAAKLRTLGSPDYEFPWIDINMDGRDWAKVQ